MTRIFPFATSIIAIALAFALPPVQASAHDHVSSEWANLLFIPNRDSNDVAVVDTRTDTLVERIPVGATPHPGHSCTHIGQDCRYQQRR